MVGVLKRTPFFFLSDLLFIFFPSIIAPLPSLLLPSLLLTFPLSTYTYVPGTVLRNVEHGSKKMQHVPSFMKVTIS